MVVETRSKRKGTEQKKASQINFAADDAANVEIKNVGLDDRANLKGEHSVKQRINELPTRTKLKPTNDQSKAKTIITKVSNEKKQTCFTPVLEVFQNAFQRPETAERFNENTILIIEPGTEYSSKSGRYRFISKISHGGCSIVWLAYEMKKKLFKVIKIFKYKKCVTSIERKVYKKTQNHPYIMQFDECFNVKTCYGKASIAVFEPLGKDLSQLIQEARQMGGIIPYVVIKKIAKDVLLALVKLHKCGFVHTDIKPMNISIAVSQISWLPQLENILKYKGSLSILRIGCYINIFSMGKFLEHGKSDDEAEIKDLVKIFGKFPRQIYAKYDASNGFLDKYTVNEYDDKKNEEQIKKNLQEIIKYYPMTAEERENLMNFLLDVFKLNRMERKTAIRLLNHPWLKDIDYWI